MTQRLSAIRDGIDDRAGMFGPPDDEDLIYLLARLASAEEALRPFADWGRMVTPGQPDDKILEPRVSVGDLRKAAAHFAATQEGK